MFESQLEEAYLTVKHSYGKNEYQMSNQERMQLLPKGFYFT